MNIIENWNRGPRASALIQHLRPREGGTTPIARKFGPGPAFSAFERVDDDEIVYAPVMPIDEVLGELVHNVITNVGRVYAHTQIYATSGIGAGINYLALSNDSLTEGVSSTTLSNEITTNGLARAQTTVTLPTGSGTQTTLAKTFTATGTQSAQKGALFNAASSGTMNHALPFTQRALILNDLLACTWTITLS